MTSCIFIISHNLHFCLCCFVKYHQSQKWVCSSSYRIQYLSQFILIFVYILLKIYSHIKSLHLACSFVRHIITDSWKLKWRSNIYQNPSNCYGVETCGRTVRYDQLCIRSFYSHVQSLQNPMVRIDMNFMSWSLPWIFSTTSHVFRDRQTNFGVLT